MVKIYVPINAENKPVREEQQRHVSKLVGEGWKHMGMAKLKDFFGTVVEVVVLERDVDGFGEYLEK